MLFYFGAHSALLLLFVVPGEATLWLLGRAAQKTEPLRQLRRQL